MDRLEQLYLELGPPALTAAAVWTAASSLAATLYFSGLDAATMAKLAPAASLYLGAAAFCWMAAIALKRRLAIAAPLIVALCAFVIWQASKWEAAVEGVRITAAISAVAMLLPVMAAALAGFTVYLLAAGTLGGTKKD